MRRTSSPPPAPCAPCCPTCSRPPPVRSSTSTAASTRWAPDRPAGAVSQPHLRPGRVWLSHRAVRRTVVGARTCTSFTRPSTGTTPNRAAPRESAWTRCHARAARHPPPPALRATGGSGARVERPGSRGATVRPRPSRRLPPSRPRDDVRRRPRRREAGVAPDGVRHRSHATAPARLGGRAAVPAPVRRPGRPAPRPGRGLPPSHGAPASCDEVGVTPAAACLAVCRRVRTVDAIGVGDWLLHRGHVDADELRGLVTAEPWRDGAAEVAWVLDQLVGDARSMRESALRCYLVFAGLPPAEPNGPIVLDGVAVHGDLWFPAYRTAVEYEGVQHQADRGQYVSDIDR